MFKICQQESPTKHQCSLCSPLPHYFFMETLVLLKRLVSAAGDALTFCEHDFFPEGFSPSSPHISLGLMCFSLSLFCLVLWFYYQSVVCVSSRHRFIDSSLTALGFTSSFSDACSVFHTASHTFVKPRMQSCICCFLVPVLCCL